MSVSTKADENIDKIRENVRESLLLLNEILVGKCWGHDEFNNDFYEMLWSINSELTIVHRKLE